MRDMHQTMQQQRDEIAKHHLQLVTDQEAAKAVFDNVAHARHLDVSYIKHLLSPLAIFNGDVLLAAQNPSNNLYLLLGDFTGHGLAAAIGALPLSDVFYGMTAKGFSLAEVIRECNRKLCSVLPAGYFCCAAGLYIDFSRQTVEFWNGGLPSVYLRRNQASAHQQSVMPLSSNHLPLGILSPERFKDDTQVVEVETADRLFLATDGVIEARNEQGEYFGADRLEQIIQSRGIEELFGSVKQDVYDFMKEEDRDDDITMVEVEIVPSTSIQPQAVAQPEEGGPSDWKFTYELGSESLKSFNPLPLLQQILMEAPYLRSRATEIHTVLAELYSNALEHGVLGLNSSLKSSAEGFAQYYAARATALDNVTGWVRFAFTAYLRGQQVKLDISIADSGPGFDYRSYLRNAACTAPTGQKYHGRGVRLLWELCDRVTYQDPGNEVEVHMSWENENG